MDDGKGWWSERVPVKGSRIGITDNIAHTVGALEKLWGWDRKNRQVKKAVDVCSKALEGMATFDQARAAFEAAAKATGNLMPRV